MKYRMKTIMICLGLGAIMSSQASLATPPSTTPDAYEKATFAGGCFWCLEHPFDVMDGVISTTSGYIGGHQDQPTYEEVSAGTTGHTEAVQVLFDSKKVDFATLLDIYWRNSDPTTANRQFCDVGSQYRPAIFYHSLAQQTIAEQSKVDLQQHKSFPEAIITEISPATTFWAAEDYHQDYARKNPIRYNYYRLACGRDQRLKQLWGKAHE